MLKGRGLRIRNDRADEHHGEIDMNWDTVKSNWKQFKDRLKARWQPGALRPRPGSHAAN